MSEHTSGPWHAGHIGTDTFRREVIFDADHGQVADIIDRGETGRAIASLMVAAPDLLQFTTKITQWLERSDKRSLARERENRGRFNSLADACKADAANYRAMAKEGRAAIARATNQNPEE